MNRNQKDILTENEQFYNELIQKIRMNDAKKNTVKPPLWKRVLDQILSIDDLRCGL